MKKAHILFTFLICVFITLSFADSVMAEGTEASSDEQIKNLRYSVNSDGVSCTITGYGSDLWIDPVIPEEIDGYKVTAIADFAFSGIRIKGNLTLPEGLEYIGDSAFFAYFDESDQGTVIGLTGDLIIPDSVTYLGNAAFCYNTFGGRLHLPPNITQIGQSTFTHCTFSGDVKIPDAVKTIGDHAFSSGMPDQYFLTDDSKMILGSNIRVIGRGAFYNCGNMGDVLVLPDNLVSLGWDAFKGCRFSTVIVPPGVMSIGEAAFAAISMTDTYDVYILSDDVTILDDSSLGYPSVSVIHGNPGSAAESFAEKNGYSFISLTEDGEAHSRYPCTDDHQYTDWYVTKQPSETDEGLRTRICIDCGTVDTETIKALNGDVDSGVYEGMNWRITPDYELILGKEGRTQSMAGTEYRTQDSYPWNDYRDIIRSVKVEGTVKAYGRLQECFANMISANKINLSGLDTSNVTDMAGMFSGCRKAEVINVSGLDTSNVTVMLDMFRSCESVIALNLTGFDTRNVIDMGGMFSDCSRLENLELSHFDTSSIKDTQIMFRNCGSLTNLDLAFLKNSSIENMQSMFEGCTNLKSLDFTDIDTSQNKYFNGVFRGCESLESIDVSNIDTKKAVYMHFMFDGCTKLKELDLSAFDMANVETAYGMLTGVEPDILKTPVNLTIDVVLSKVMYDEGGTSYAMLPKNSSQSIALYASDPTVPSDQEPDPEHVRQPQSVRAEHPSYNKTTNSSSFRIKVSSETPLSFSSSNTRVAAVDGTGLVKLKGPGKAVITAKAAETDLYESASCTVTINVSLARPTLKAVNLKGKRVKLTWTKSAAADGYKIYIKGPGDKKYKLRLTKSSRVKSVTHKGLVKGKKYKYKIVAFKKVNGKTVTSAYSAVRTVKIKK